MRVDVVQSTLSEFAKRHWILGGSGTSLEWLLACEKSTQNIGPVWRGATLLSQASPDSKLCNIVPGVFLSVFSKASRGLLWAFGRDRIMLRILVHFVLSGIRIM